MRLKIPDRLRINFWRICILYINERRASHLHIKKRFEHNKGKAFFLKGEIPLDLKAYWNLCAFMLRRDAGMLFSNSILKNQMNKQSAIMNIVPELHIGYKSRDWLLSASAQRYFAGNLHHNTLLPIGLDLIKQTRGSAFFYRFHLQWWLDIFLSKNNVIPQLRNREHSSSYCNISSALPSIFLACVLKWSLLWIWQCVRSMAENSKDGCEP